MAENKRFRLRRKQAEAPQQQFSGVEINGVTVTSLTQLADIAGWNFRDTVTRAEALSVPSVVKARNLLVASVTGMPLHVFKKDGTKVDPSWLDQPDPRRARSAILADTLDDLFFEGIGYWRATAFGNGGIGYPTAAEYLAARRVGRDGNAWTIDGRQVAAREVICFEGLTPGVLKAGGGNAIRDAINLQRAAKMFSDSPLPIGYFTNTDPAITPDEVEILKFLADFEAARRSGAYGFVPGSVELKVPGMDPEKLQLADSRQHADLNISRATNSEPEDLGISTTSRTYFNASQQRKDSLDFNVSLFTRPIEERLSMADITPRGQYVRCNYDAFLRTDTLSRYQAYAIALNPQTGWLERDEVRALENLQPLGTKNPGAGTSAPVSEGSEDDE